MHGRRDGDAISVACRVLRAPRGHLLRHRQGRDAPFTTGLIKRNDPYRQDSNFAEAPPDASGDLVTYADLNRDGFYAPGTDMKFLLGAAKVTAANAVHAAGSIVG